MHVCVCVAVCRWSFSARPINLAPTGRGGERERDRNPPPPRREVGGKDGDAFAEKFTKESCAFIDACTTREREEGFEEGVGFVVGVHRAGAWVSEPAGGYKAAAAAASSSSSSSSRRHQATRKGGGRQRERPATQAGRQARREKARRPANQPQPTNQPTQTEPTETDGTSEQASERANDAKVKRKRRREALFIPFLLVVCLVSPFWWRWLRLSNRAARI